MAGQLVFLTGLYGIGILAGLPFRRAVPAAFIGLSAFLWGMLLWVGSLLVWLMFTRQPVFPGGLVVLGLVTAGLAALNLRLGTWRMSRRDWLWCLLPLLGFVLTGLAALRWNFSFISYDGITQIFLGDTFTLAGLTDIAVRKMLSWGPGLPILHTMNRPLGIDYLSLLHPLTAYTFVLTWLYLTQRSLRALDAPPRLAYALTVGIAVLVFSSWGMIFQFFYIHNSLHTAVYLFTAVAALWLGLREENTGWYAVSAAAFMGAGLFRLEIPLVAVLFLAVLVSFQGASLRGRALTALVITGGFLVMTAWILALTIDQGLSGGVFSTGSAWMKFLALVAFGSLVILVWRRVPLVARLAPYLPQIMLLVFALGFVAGTAWKPNFMWTSFDTLVFHLLLSGFWGASMLALGAMVVMAYDRRVPYAALFTYPIPAFLIMALLLRLPNATPYYRGNEDSLSRMVTYILPVFALYAGLKMVVLLRPDPNALQD